MIMKQYVPKWALCNKPTTEVILDHINTNYGTAQVRYPVLDYSEWVEVEVVPAEPCCGTSQVSRFTKPVTDPNVSCQTCKHGEFWSETNCLSSHHKCNKHWFNLSTAVSSSRYCDDWKEAEVPPNPSTKTEPTTGMEKAVYWESLTPGPSSARQRYDDHLHLQDQIIDGLLDMLTTLIKKVKHE